MKNLIYLSLALCLPLLNSCSGPAESANTISDTIPVQVMVLQQQNNRSSMAVSGQFTTDDEVMLSFKTGGIISSLHVKEGDRVKKGQLLATLNPTEINAQVQQAKLSVEKAQRDYQRSQNLYKDSVATLEQLQNSKTMLQQSQEQLRMATFNRQYSEIHAPEDGFILSKLANAGQQVTAGTPILKTNGAASGKWMLRVGISDYEWATLQLNDKAEIQTSSLPGQIFEGRLSRKSEGVDAATGTFSADIVFSGKKPDAIAAGMFGKAIIKPSALSTGSSSWQIPYEALLDGNGSNGYVFVTNDRKTAKKLKVTIGAIDKNTVTITHGLEDATALIISGSAYLTDQSPITVKSSKTAAQ
ncbi:efflux RND transporter periplasmic adaptor subunit [Pedobacter sp. MC2016-15]|uniref:efflux RND transporter periplasmic adaptor subunit n=1 Tax=Pedobacter sp. MC2016-15 TaxID=2994473 RepID=UPI002246E174|nr:efflux RND transporter periplasmic adaptor subunit [Pedobacter sp. MC2016-15]MCX2480581.1 efflux RND transporter periplasmic adaptor subunit [Pedobacter sp. MC2016-15]